MCQPDPFTFSALSRYVTVNAVFWVFNLPFLLEFLKSGDCSRTRMNAGVFAVFVAKYGAVRGCFPVALPSPPKPGKDRTSMTSQTNTLTPTNPTAATEKAATVWVLPNYIGGRWVAAQASGLIDVTNPANGEVLGSYSALGRL